MQMMSHLPPGPRSTLLATMRYLRDPFGSLLAARDRFGDPYTWPTFLGKVVVTGDPAGVKTLLSADPDIYSALGADLLGPVLGQNNLILLSGERHRAMRKLQNPQFRGERLQAYGRTITSVAETHIGRWPSDEPFPIQETMQAISLDVILQAVLGLSDPTSRVAFKEAVLSMVAALKPSFMFWPALRRPMLGWSAWSRFQRQRTTGFPRRQGHGFDRARHGYLPFLRAGRSLHLAVKSPADQCLPLRLSLLRQPHFQQRAAGALHGRRSREAYA